MALALALAGPGAPGSEPGSWVYALLLGGLACAGLSGACRSGQDTARDLDWVLVSAPESVGVRWIEGCPVCLGLQSD